MHIVEDVYKWTYIYFKKCVKYIFLAFMPQCLYGSYFLLVAKDCHRIKIIIRNLINGQSCFMVWS